CHAPCEARSGVRLRAGTLSTPFTDISTSRIQTGEPGAMPMTRASSGGAPSAYSASTRRRTWPTWRRPAVRAPGRNSQWRMAGGRTGGATASQPGASGGRWAAGFIMAAYYAKPEGRLANAYNTGHGKSTNLQAHVRARTLLAPRG